MYCKNCGKLLAGDERFCSNCGTKVATDGNAFETQQDQEVAIESFPTSEMIWDLDDFEVPKGETEGDSDFQWGSKDMFAGQEVTQSEREQDAADYKGPLMFRKEDKAPSKEEIEKKEKEEESTKKSTLYADDGGKGQGHRWDITKVEIPKTNVELEVDGIQLNGDSPDEKEAVEPANKREFVGFVKDEEPVLEEPKKEFIGFAKPKEVDPEAERQAAATKEELQAVLDQAIDEAIEQDFPSKKEKKDIVFNWNQNVDLSGYTGQDGGNTGDTASKEVGPAEMEPDPDVVDNNMSLTLEELSAGVNIKSDNVPASNYDQSKKTIRNVLSKEAMKKTINFSMDEINAQQEKIAREEERKAAIEREKAEQAAKAKAAKKAEEEAAMEAMKMKAVRAARQAERAAKLELARAAQAAENAKQTVGATENPAKTHDRIVDIEQPKKSNISLEIHQDHITGDKIEKVIDDEPKVPEETLKPTVTEKPEFAHREINDDIKVGQVQVGEDEDVMEQIMSSSEELDKDDDKVRFYTFNKNKEDFQKLLDQEYKRLEDDNQDTEGFEADIASFMNVERGKNVEATSQIEEMNKARSVFLNRPSYDDVSVYEDEDFDQSILSSQDEVADKAAKLRVIDGQETEVAKEPSVATPNLEKDGAIADIAPEKVRIVFEPQKDESLVETLIEKEKAKDQEPNEKVVKEPSLEPKAPKAPEKPAKPSTDEAPESKKDYLHDDVGKLIIDPKEMSKTEKLASDFFDDDEDVKPRSKGKNILFGIITIIVVIIIALLGIKVIIPESPISKVMDDMGNKVVNTVSGVFGGDKVGAEKDNIREDVIEDKTKLIKSKIDNNYNNNIEKIIGDDNLVYDPDGEYDLSGLVDAKDIQTVLWYQDNKGKPYYYDEEIVGTIIEFVSMKSAWQSKEDRAVFSVLGAGTKEYEKVASLEKNNGAESVAVLAIGDIKVAGNAYYVWTAETVGDNTVKRVYEIKEQDQKLYVNDDCEI